MESNFVEINGLKLHYLKLGNGPPLVFLHGHRSDAMRWIKLIEKASEKFTIYAPDLPGFGLSEQLKTTHKLKNFVPYIEEFVQKIGLEKYYLSGGSMGANIALLMANHNPKAIIKLFLIVPLYNRGSLKMRKAKILSALTIIRVLPKAHIYNFFDWFIKKDKLFKNFLKWRFPKEERDDSIINYETHQWRIMSIKVWAETLSDLLKSDFSKFSPINVPSTVFLAGEDQYLNVDKEAEGFKKLLPNGKIVVVPKVPHVPKGDIPQSLIDKLDVYFNEL